MSPFLIPKGIGTVNQVGKYGEKAEKIKIRLPGPRVGQADVSDDKKIES